MTGWSYSGYSTAVQCLRKYKYAYVDKIVPEGPDSGDLLFGSALHSAINACLTGQDGSATFEIYWNSYRDKEIEYGRFRWDDLAQIGSGFIRKFFKYHAPKYELKFAEKRLFANYKGVKFEGTPDFYGNYSGRTSLRDFKTSGRNYEPAKATCALQLYLYAYLLLQNGVCETPLQSLGYTVFNKGTGSIQDLTWDFHEKDMYKALEDLVSYCKGIDSHNSGLVKGDWYPRNLNACLDYSRKCPYFSKCHGKENE